MTAALRKGTAVSWKWGANTAHGRVEESFTRAVSRTIKGKRVRRKGSREEPTYLVSQEDGGRALKSHSELTEER
jgi:hypothetical protein